MNIHKTIQFDDTSQFGASIQFDDPIQFAMRRADAQPLVRAARCTLFRVAEWN